MTSDQTEIPVGIAPAIAEPIAEPTEPSATPLLQTPAKGTETFTLLAGLPWRFADPMCCTKYSAELWQDETDQTYITCTHSDECEVWRFMP